MDSDLSSVTRLWWKQLDHSNRGRQREIAELGVLAMMALETSDDCAVGDESPGCVGR